MASISPAFAAVAQSQVDWLGTDPIPAAPYYDPAYFQIERQAVFLRSWIMLGHVCELPRSGSFIRRDVEFAKASLLIVRGRDDAIRAFHNVCPHRGTQLVEDAEGTRARFSCPYHMWTFGMDGALLSAPDFDAFRVGKEDCRLRSVRLEIVAGMIFVNFDPDAQPLRQSLGVFAQQMDTAPVAQASCFSQYSYEIDANWKLCFDNFQENYHLRFLHPRTGRNGASAENPFGYPTQYRFNGQHRGETLYYDRTATPQGPVQALAGARAGAALMERGLFPGPHGDEYFAVFPNLFMLANPFQNFTHVVYPIAENRSRGVIRVYWVGDPRNASEAFGREYHLMLLRDIHSEDLAVITAGARGLASGALTHIHFQTQEVLCRHLFQQVDAMVGAFRDEAGKEAVT